MKKAFLFIVVLFSSIYLSSCKSETRYLKELIIEKDIKEINDLRDLGYNSNYNLYGNPRYSLDEVEAIYYGGTIDDWYNVKLNYKLMTEKSKFYYKSPNGRITFNEEKYDLLYELTIPENITKIGDYQFYNFTQITKVSFNNKLESIGKYAFYNCRMSVIDLPDNVKEIDEGAFCSCTNVGSFNIPKNVSHIHEKTFYGLESLNEIIIPEWVEEISEDAFSSCENVKRIVISDSVEKINGSPFYLDLAIEIETPSRFIQKFSTSNLKKLILTTDDLVGTEYSGGFNLNIDSLETIILKEGIKTIPGYSLSMCKNLKSIIIPSTVTSIGVAAFTNDKNLESIYYFGNDEQYSNISIKKTLNDHFLKTPIYYYSENEPMNVGNYWHYDSNNNPVKW